MAASSNRSVIFFNVIEWSGEFQRMPFGLETAPYCTYRLKCVRQAQTIIRLMTVSTGTKSATLVPVPSMVRKMPLPTAAMMPFGPFQLSTHPFTGSRSDERTAKKNIGITLGLMLGPDPSTYYYL